ncbi:hypothetical protein JTB14_003693 [Gonioctena quinquepunctata]|nr:hypothetical protein JTB14_003693 [Gonioctena quinquepunctata]
MEHTILASIMRTFSLFYSNEEDALLSYADIRNFQNTWNVVDIHQPVPVRRVTFILRLLKGRLVVDPPKRHTFIQTHMLRVRKITHWRRFDIRKALQLEELMAREEFENIIEGRSYKADKKNVSERNNQISILLDNGFTGRSSETN